MITAPRESARSLVALAVVAMLCLSACGGGDGATLRVRVFSDWVPEAQARTSVVTLWRAMPDQTRERVDAVEVRLDANAALIDGLILGEFQSLSGGAYAVSVMLMRPNGEQLAQRFVNADVRSDTEIEVHLSAACDGVVCAGADGRTQCLAGTCVPPECSSSSRESCPTNLFCVSDADCGAAASTCETRRCVAGVCESAQLADACDASEFCRLGTGCVPRDPPPTPTQPGADDGSRCGTICLLPSEPCRYGYYDCLPEQEPVCVVFVRRPKGAPCGHKLVCDADGACVAEPMDAGIADASVDSFVDATVRDAMVRDSAARDAHLSDLGADGPMLVTHDMGSSHMPACAIEPPSFELTAWASSWDADRPCTLREGDELSVEYRTVAGVGAGLYAPAAFSWSLLVSSQLQAIAEPSPHAFSCGDYAKMAVTVRAVDDAFAQGDREAHVAIVVDWSDPYYASIGSPPDLVCTIIDDDDDLDAAVLDFDASVADAAFDAPPDAATVLVDECLLGTHTCDVGERCDDLAEGFTCHAVASLALGATHTCALFDDGGVKCWGSNAYGQLGTGDTLNRGDQPMELGAHLPLVDLGAGRYATTLATGGNHNCAILDDQSLVCWGSNAYGQLGVGDMQTRGDDPAEPLVAVDLGTSRYATALALGFKHTCALLDDGSVKCFGFNSEGQLGLGDISHRGDALGEMGDALPTIDFGTDRTALAISAFGSDGSSCAILDDHSLKCWGQSANGILGLGDANDRGNGTGPMGDALPAMQLGTGLTASFVSVGYYRTCAVLNDSTLKCWGHAWSGQLGLGEGDFFYRGDNPGEMGDMLPRVNLGTGRTVTSMSSRGLHACLILDDGSLKCFGYNDKGQLGYGDTVARGGSSAQMGNSLPQVNLGAARSAVFIAVGQYHSCAILDDGGVKCWGPNHGGELGLGLDVTNHRGDEAGEMGDALAYVPL